MIKSKCVQLLLCGIFLVDVVYALDFETTLFGRAINVSKDSTWVSGLSVQLQSMSSEEHRPQSIAEMTTGMDGTFKFTINNADTANNYFAVTDYQGVRYFTKPVRFKKDGQIIETELFVYDSTQTTDNVSAMMHHVILEDHGDYLNVRETKVLNNSGKKAITDVINDNQIEHGTLKFHLQPNITNFEPVSSRFGNELIKQGHFVYDMGIFLPGNRQLSYSYDIPWQDDQTLLSLDIKYATRSLDVFVSDPDVNLESSVLQDLGPFTIRNTSYHRYGAQNVAANERVQLNFTRTGKSTRRTMGIIPIAMVILGAGIFYRLTKRSINTMKVTVNQEELKKRKKELIQEIASLESDSAYPNETLKKHRDELFADLQNVELDLRLSSNNRKKKSK